MHEDSTICAISTPHGTGAIAVLRLSGKDAFLICNKIFISKKVNKQLYQQKANTVHYGSIVDGNDTIDEAIVAIFKAPHSFTGEDVAEISVHGSPYIQQKVLQILIDKGARMAEPGEFTLRAFLNGKMDLSQAEAVADLISSNSEASRKVAMNQMKGGFSNELSKLRKKLLEFIALVELELDFAEEDVEFADRKQIYSLIDELIEVISKLTGSFELGNVIKNGIPVTIIGEPNVGKSTLLNLLLREEKAIVSDIAGTTRDVIEDIISIKGIQFRFIDTAGLRHTTDKIETLGIERTHKKIEQAVIVILIVDAANDPDTIKKNIKKQKIQLTGKQEVIIAVNKTDTVNEEELKTKFIQNQFNIVSEKDKLVFMSAKQNKGLIDLEELLLEMVHYKHLDNNEVIVTNVRHYEALIKSHGALLRAKNGLDLGLSGDLLSQDVREALHYIGEITGEITTDEVLGHIFENFCIGK